MEDLNFYKHPGGSMSPAFTSDAESMERVKNGLVKVKVVRPRNPDFHARFFAMLNFGFDYWNPMSVMVDGVAITPEKSFDRYRKDLLIIAGFRKVVVNLKNEVRYEAESISFANMDEDRFREVYRLVFGVLWDYVLSRVDGMSKEHAENTINQMLDFM